jgi:hypothetical protein
VKRKTPAQKKLPPQPFLYLVLVVVGSVLFGLVSWIRLPQTVVCANTLSCSSTPTLAVENDAIGIFENQAVLPPRINLAEAPTTDNVLGEETATGEKHIYVDLATQTLSAYQGDTLFMQTPISAGKWNRTPKGEFTIWIKIKSTRMSGGSGNDYYNLPNVPYVMFFYNDKVAKSTGYSFHGAYWHNNFGHAMSHGCVNMRAIDAEKLYNWATPTTTGSTTYADATNTGTKVTIY